tara:strand:- start:48 stop:248 length:201 start_codon:yes stop_codon:yes gene_type:complete
MQYGATWVIVAVVSSITLMGFYECLRARWKRREQHIEDFKKKLDAPMEINIEGTPIRKKRKPFIQI